MGHKKYMEPFERVRCWKDELDKPSKWKKPKKIFACSMSDIFHPHVKTSFILSVFYSTETYHKHTFQFLTKRTNRFEDLRLLRFEWPDNVWMGVSVEHSGHSHRITDLKKTNAAVKFISFEPLLGPVPELNLKGIDWVIVGGESGPRARPLRPVSVRYIRDECIRQNVPFFFKGWGSTVKEKSSRVLDGVTHEEFPRAK
jgi:protein gp37